MKNKTTATICALFLGVFGIHRFYLKQTKLGILYLLFSWTLIPFFIGVIDSLVLMFMTKEKFNLKFNTNIVVTKNDKIIEPKKEKIDYYSKSYIEPKTTINLDFDAKPIEELLQNVNNLKSINEINLWDNNAIVQIEKIKTFKEKLQNANNSILIMIEESQQGGFLDKINKKNKILTDNKGFLSQYKSVIEKLDLYSNELDYWVALSPNSMNELNEMKLELKEKKQLLAIKKRELNIVKRDMWNLYRADAAYVEFSSPKFRHFNRGLNMRNREDNLSPYHKAVKEVDLQLIQIDKIILWLNKIK